MQKAKLLKLADFMENTIPKRNWHKYFNLGRWADKLWPKKKCNSTACAVGWATACFPRSGLKLVGVEFVSNELDVEYTDSRGNRSTGLSAASAFFDISYEDAEYLFADSYDGDIEDVKPSTVIKRIRNFVDGKIEKGYHQDYWNYWKQTRSS